MASAKKQTMLAWVMVKHHSSASDKRYALKMDQVEMPELVDGQVLVKIQHAALNRRDHWIR